MKWAEPLASTKYEIKSPFSSQYHQWSKRSILGLAGQFQVNLTTSTYSAWSYWAELNIESSIVYFAETLPIDIAAVEKFCNKQKQILQNAK